MATFKQKQKQQQNQGIAIGIVLVLLITGAVLLFNNIFSGDDELLVKRDKDTNCPIDGARQHIQLLL